MSNRDLHDLDLKLSSVNQQAIREVVRSLPEESLSLAWRSGLNERLHAVRQIPKWRARLMATWRPALGVALAASLGLIMILRPSAPVHQTSDQTLEANLVREYDDSANSEVVAGPGLAVHEVSDTTRTRDTSSDWTESDLNTL